MLQLASVAVFFKSFPWRPSIVYRQRLQFFDGKRLKAVCETALDDLPYTWLRLWHFTNNMISEIARALYKVDASYAFIEKDTNEVHSSLMNIILILKGTNPIMFIL